MQKVNLAEKLSTFSEHWSPRIISAYNGNDIMVVKFQGEFPFHDHPETDDFFLVLEGQVFLDVESETHVLEAGELFVVPAGVKHRPRADKEAKVLLIEPQDTPNTGDPETAVAKPKI